MRLEQITLENYRCFDRLTVDLHPQLTVLIAPNGGGKTSILDATRVLFDTYLGAFPTGVGKGIRVSDVRLAKVEPDSPFWRKAFPCQIQARGELSNRSGTLTWSRALNTEKSGTTIKDARALANFGKTLQQQALDPNDQTIWPLLSYQGTGRLWNQKKLTSGKIFSSGFFDRAAGYTDCLEPASNYKMFANWFGYAYRSVTQAKIRFMESHPAATPQEIIGLQSSFSPLIDAVREAVNVVLRPTGWGDIWYSETDKEVTAGHADAATLAVSQLSDGIRNSLALVADIAFRAVQLNPHLGADAGRLTHGIVLIDEVDMHLHPSWQQLILQLLREAFPRLQFIVTTHSPQVLSTVKRECIRVLGQDANGQFIAEPPLAMTYGEPSGNVLHSVMQVDPQPPVAEREELNRLTELVDQGLFDSGEAKNLFGRLQNILGEQHPQLQRLQRSIRRQEALKG